MADERSAAQNSQASQSDPVDFSPTIDGDRCVHGLSPIAQCRACVAICPLSAIALDEDGLTVDASACDGCGLCVAACPEQAMTVDAVVAPPVHDREGVQTAYLACARVAAIGNPGVTPCLHATSATQLAELHRRGVRQILVSHGDCASCSRNTPNGLEPRLSALGRLLVDRALPPIALIRSDVKAWTADREEASRPNRRALFRAVLGRKTEAVAQSEQYTVPLGAVAPGAILPARATARLAEAEPVIDRATCTACGACVEVCPQRSLALVELSEAEDKPAYRIDATLCTGCGLCVNNCDVGAISLAAWGRAHPEPIALTRGRCRGCGTPYLYIDGGPVGSELCRICATTRHRKNLFQVLP